jgi:hypothetical protein
VVGFAGLEMEIREGGSPDCFVASCQPELSRKEMTPAQALVPAVFALPRASIIFLVLRPLVPSQTRPAPPRDR